MTDLQKNTIMKFRLAGMRYSQIAEKVGIPKSTVISFCHKNCFKITESPINDHCPQCDAELRHIPGKKKKRFCCDKCRQAWWNATRITGPNRAMERGERD